MKASIMYSVLVTSIYPSITSTIRVCFRDIDFQFVCTNPTSFRWIFFMKALTKRDRISVSAQREQIRDSPDTIRLHTSEPVYFHIYLRKSDCKYTLKSILYRYFRRRRV